MYRNSVSYRVAAGNTDRKCTVSSAQDENTESVGDRAVIYLDLANVERGFDADRRYNRIDYGSMINALADGHDYCGGWAFVADGGPFPEYHAICVELQRFGIRTNREGYYDPNTKGQKGVDMSMGVTASMGATNNEYDTVVLVTGDSDFLPAADAIRGLGKKVKFASFSGSLNKRILEKGYEVIYLDKIPMMEFVDRSDDFDSPIEEAAVHV